MKNRIPNYLPAPKRKAVPSQSANPKLLDLVQKQIADRMRVDRNVCPRAPGDRNRCGILHRDFSGMGHQTKISDQNGSPRSASKGLARDVGEFAYDVLTLAELQAQLFVADMQECGQRVR